MRVPEADAAQPPEEGFVLGGEPAPIAEEDCSVFAPPERRGGSLLVRTPPDRVKRTFLGRLRSHTDGSLSAGARRVWVGRPVPGFVALTDNTAELTLLDDAPDGELFALYRDPYGASSCSLNDQTNCRFVVKLIGNCGEERWSLHLNQFMSRTSYLELQDVRLHDGIVYFNEACQSYSSRVKGKCSALLAVDPKTKKLLWRSKHLVSNGRFLVHGDYIVTGYGFTAERDAVYVLRRSDGKVMQRIGVPKAPENFTLRGKDLLDVTIYPGNKVRSFRLKGWTGQSPRLVPVK